MIQPETSHLGAAGAFLVPLILTAILFHDLRRHLHQISSKQIRITTIICFVSCMVVSSFFVIWNFVKYVALISPNTDQEFYATLSTILLYPRMTSGITNFIFVAWFITLKLGDVYQDTFLSINKRVVTICFIIYVIIIILWHTMLVIVYIASHWHAPFAGEPYQLLLTITTMAYSFASELYFGLILILFNIKLFKFISLTMKNNETLSLEINNRFQHFIIKQTNLISIITIAFIVYQIIAYWRWVDNNADTLDNLLYPMVMAAQQSIWSICIYLTFKFNHRYYDTCCKHSHHCCVHLCTKLTTCAHKSQDSRAPYLSMVHSMPSVTSLNKACRSSKAKDEMSVVEVHCVMQNCPDFAKIVGILSSYNDQMYDELYRDYNAANVLDSFHHLLQCHDSEEDFNRIHQKLTSNHPSCNYEQCAIHSRHYSRRRRFIDGHTTHEVINGDQKESVDKDMNSYSMTDILDKLHVFYYHSYDTFARPRLSLTQTIRDEDERIAHIHQMIKNKKNAFSLLRSNKFNSDLKPQENTNNMDIYSFGERFEYESEYKSSPWFVEAKYDSLKSEFVDNTICSISMEEYQMEHSKCMEYMKTIQVKMIQSNEQGMADKDVSIDHLFSLLIYCNCDDYQAKWSETFRQTPCNESDESLKKRHSHFYYCSKYLRHLIEYFGSSLIHVDNANKTFYHGVNQVLYFTRTITKFNAPLSTPTEATVALNFSGDEGVVLELKYSSSVYLLHAKYFDCAFFSDFVEEKECLFVGGVPMLIITNIMNISNSEMYRKYVNALNVINCILNGTLQTDNKRNYDFSDASIHLCTLLLSYQLEKNEHSDVPSYIMTLLNRYCTNLKHIMVFWHHMEIVKELKDLLCSNKKDAAFFDLHVILKLFPNAERIEYFNQSKSIIQDIIDHVSSMRYNECNLKYVIIHHKGSSSIRKTYDGNGNWDVFQDDSRVIVFQDDEINFDLMHFRFNQINQANASKNMIRNLF